MTLKSTGDIETMVGTLSLDLDDATSVPLYITDVIERLGASNNPPFIAKVDVNLSTSVATYDYPSYAIKIHAAIMHDYLLGKETESSFNAYSLTWASEAGTSKAIYEDMLSRQYSLFPEPDFNSGNQLYLFYNERRLSSIQEYYALPITLLSLAREFTKSSVNQAPEMAQQAENLGALILNLMGHYDYQWNQNSK